ncbi:hypothetical protein [Candidatus Sororendozoicomonas aggregata]|uniref:hypothetical protein n=1 Tax=Candidatus Sororendozoicomonas aggregata TaxID=3073239 RepID=UPI002ED54C78
MAIPPNGRGPAHPQSPSSLASEKTGKSGSYTVSKTEGRAPIAEGREAADSSDSTASSTSSPARKVSRAGSSTSSPSTRSTFSDSGSDTSSPSTGSTFSDSGSGTSSPPTRSTFSDSGTTGTWSSSATSQNEEYDSLTSDDDSLTPDDSVSQIGYESSEPPISTAPSNSEPGQTRPPHTPGELDDIQGGNPEAKAAANSALAKFKDALPNGKSGAGLAMALTGGALMAVPVTAPVGVALFIVGILMYAMNADDDGSSDGDSSVAPRRPGPDDDRSATSENSDDESLSGEFFAEDKYADKMSTPEDPQDTSLERMEKARDKVTKARNLFIALGVSEEVVDNTIDHLWHNGGAVSPDFFLTLFGELSRSFPKEGISEETLKEAARANGCEDLLPENSGSIDPDDPRLAEYNQLGRTLSGIQ